MSSSGALCRTRMFRELMRPLLHLGIEVFNAALWSFCREPCDNALTMKVYSSLRMQECCRHCSTRRV